MAEALPPAATPPTHSSSARPTTAETAAKAKAVLLSYSARIKGLTNDFTALQATHAALTKAHEATLSEVASAKAQAAAAAARSDELQASLPTTADEAALADLANLLATASK